MRIGTKKRPFYRVVVVDERAKRTGGYIELLGTYNPLTEPKDIKLKQDRIDHWIKQGAQPSDGYLRMTGKAPQRPPRKPKKEKKAEETVAPAPAAAPAPTPETPAEQPQAEEKPAEEAKVEEATPVIPNASEESQDSNPEIATEPSAPHNDKEKKENKKNERSA